MIKFDPVKLRFNRAKAKARIMPYLIMALNEAADELLKAMRINASKTVHGDGPGKPEWRGEIDRDLKKLYFQVANDYLEFGVGLDYSDGTYQQIRAMIVAYGAGSAAGNEPIARHPGGHVWNDDLTGTTISRARTDTPLPQGFNQEGNDFINKSVEETRQKMDEIVAKAVARIPNSVLLGCVEY